MELLLKLLPRYSAHIAKYPDTLLIKYLGLHRIKPANGGKACVFPVCHGGSSARSLSTTPSPACTVVQPLPPFCKLALVTSQGVRIQVL